MARILVTGGAGFIGSHLVDLLVSERHAVSVLDDFSTGEWQNLEQARAAGDVTVFEGSIDDPEAVATAINGCSSVFHLAVRSVRESLGQPLKNHAVNATGTLHVLEAARRSRVSRFVYCSSSEVYGNASSGLLSEDKVICEPMTVYGAAKLAGEYYTKAYYRTYKLPAIVVRPFNTYGPREHHQGTSAEVIPRFVIRVLNDLPPIIFGDGSNGRDFTYVSDTVRGIFMASQCAQLTGKEVNLAYGEMISVGDVALKIIEACGKSGLVPEFIDPRPGDVNVLRADTSLAESAMGYVAEIGFMDGLKRYLSWFSETYPDPSGLVEDSPVNWKMPD